MLSIQLLFSFVLLLLLLFQLDYMNDSRGKDHFSLCSTLAAIQMLDYVGGAAEDDDGDDDDDH